MPTFGSRSRQNLDTCDPRLQRVFERVVETYDCTVICGHRGKADQEAAVAAGHSKTPWPKSRHNELPSEAADVAPYPIDWYNTKRFYHFAGYVLATARGMGIELRWGGDWDGDNDLDDQTFMDLVHFELKRPGGQSV